MRRVDLMPWEVIIRNAYPEFERYSKEELHCNLCTPSVEELIRWYRFIEWWHAQRVKPVIEQEVNGAPDD